MTDSIVSAAQQGAATGGEAAVKGTKKGAGPKAAKKAGGSSKKVSGAHPKYSEMVKQALMALKERGGSSRQAVLKYIVKHFDVGKDENVVNTHLKMALRAGVKNASLKQSKGARGATGSFRLGGEKETTKKATGAGAKKPKKVAKPTTKKAKSPKKKTTMVKKATTKTAAAAPKKVTKKSSPTI